MVLQSRRHYPRVANQISSAHGGLAFIVITMSYIGICLRIIKWQLRQVTAKVSLPANQFTPASDYFKVTAYASSGLVNAQVIDNQNFIFTAQNLNPQEKLTIAAGWSKGLVSEQSFLA